MSTISCTEQGIPVPLTHILLDTAYEYGFSTRSCDRKQPITVPHVALTVDEREQYLRGKITRVGVHFNPIHH